jgi:hypothetical protein
VRNGVRVSSVRGMSVKDDWRAWLPNEKDEVFRSYVHYLEVGYNMLSVSLDEALSLRQKCLFAKASQAVGVTVDLCNRFASPLVALLWSLGEHAKHHGTVPNTAPLDPTNFQGARGQRVARFNALLSRVLLSERSQFLYKISTLGEMVADLCHDFCGSAADIAESVSMASDTCWSAIDAAHYDLNTCLRETIVLLKSFLRALPDNELGVFQTTVCTQMAVTLPRKAAFGQRLVRHRRIASIAGE